MNTAIVTETDSTAHIGATEFLTFKLGGEEYAIDIQKVHEIRNYEICTRIANSPDFVKGVVNLRGSIAPVVDMRIRFHLGNPTYGPFTVVIVVNVRGHVVGIVVDSVSDVVALSGDDIKAAPQIGAASDIDHLVGLGVIEGRMLLLIDIDRLISGSEIGMIEKLAA